MQTLTLSGWAQPTDALIDLVPHALTFDYSDYPNADAAIEGLRVFKDIPRVVAWSLGGQLTLRAIAAGALAPKTLIIIAPAYQFVNTPDFTVGMSPITFTQFRNNYAHDTARTTERFHALIAKGHPHPRDIMHQLRHHPQVADTARWLPWLDALGTDTLQGLTIPALTDVTLLHGAQDAIVPVGQADYIRALLPSARYDRWEDAGHAPHLQDRERFTSLLA